MTKLSDINLEFLSDEKLINVLRPILDEIDTVANYEAHRSTTYLAVSVIEGVFRELINLLGLTYNNVATWPKNPKTNLPIKPKDLTLELLGNILKDEKKLPQDFDDLYDRVRGYRNYMHTAEELRKLRPIDQAVSHLTLACLTALLHQYSPLRFLATQQWRLECGNAHPQVGNSIDMQHSGEIFFALLVSELPAKNFKEITFRVTIPQDKIFNFVYNYSSKNRFMAARIDKRKHTDPMYYHGLLKCPEWRSWDIIDHYTEASEPRFQKQEHDIRVILSPATSFGVEVDGKPLVLKGGTAWNFNPDDKIGFMTELGMVTIKDISVS